MFSPFVSNGYENACPQGMVMTDPKCYEWGAIIWRAVPMSDLMWIVPTCLVAAIVVATARFCEYAQCQMQY